MDVLFFMLFSLILCVLCASARHLLSFYNESE